MQEQLTFQALIWRLITDCQSGFLLYTIIYFAIRISKRKDKLREFDRCATIVICTASLLFLAVWMGETILIWNTSDESQNAILNRMTGSYALAYWLQPMLYSVIPQLLWMRKVRENYISRFLIAFFLFFNFEKFVIIVTSLHRDYLPSSWTMYSDSFFPYLILGLLWKLALFAGLTSLLYAMRKKKDNFAP
ncbi:hypothetical protein [Flavobacterium sp.]|uniref:hypothetical protein n=1 Tax=Flavobacterium sp. TaxID=239 RepID=UPI0011FBB9B2|nr:hypothetical protein [Flavobacterium sp.]RZJ69622.1 MAG: hypothetical protein EOO49_16870 [Flavobacterium sp.]